MYGIPMLTSACGTLRDFDLGTCNSVPRAPGPASSVRSGSVGQATQQRGGLAATWAGTLARPARNGIPAQISSLHHPSRTEITPEAPAVAISRSLDVCDRGRRFGRGVVSCGPLWTPRVSFRLVRPSAQNELALQSSLQGRSANVVSPDQAKLFGQSSVSAPRRPTSLT